MLDALGFGAFANARDISHLHLRKAERESVTLLSEDVHAEPYDDHNLHVAEHTRALLSGAEEDEKTCARFKRHIIEHETMKKEKGE